MTLFSIVNQLRFRPRTGHPRHWGGNDLFFLEITSAAMSSDANPSNFIIITSQMWSLKVGHGKKLGHKHLWLLEMGHGTKKFENHCYRQKIVQHYKSTFYFPEHEDL